MPLARLERTRKAYVPTDCPSCAAKCGECLCATCEAERQRVFLRKAYDLTRWNVIEGDTH